MDDWNDDQAGDNRDGDEQWYQYRTQSFCANAAFSLYGQKKKSIFNFGGGCTERHYINSYFTYGGADNLLIAVGITPLVHNDGSESNAVCVDGGGGDDDDGGSSSTLGCDKDGNYIMGSFSSESCDGNYFTKSIDTFDDYNQQFEGVGCTSIWDRSSYTEGAADELYTLLTNSWTCDTKLYPQRCPDPYGKKAQHEFALHIASEGGNAHLSYWNSEMKMPFRILSGVLVALSSILLTISYCITNQKRDSSRYNDDESGMELSTKGSVRSSVEQLEEELSIAKDRLDKVKEDYDSNEPHGLTEQQSKELEMKQEEYNKVLEQLERERQIQIAERERMNALLNGGEKAQSPRRKLIKAVSRSWSRLKRKK